MKPSETEGRVILETAEEVYGVGGALYEIDPSRNGLGLQLIDRVEAPYEISDHTVTLALDGLKRELDREGLSEESRRELEHLRSELVINSLGAMAGLEGPIRI